MKHLNGLLLLGCFFLIASCEAIKSIFNAGFWTGAFIVAIIVIIGAVVLVKINKKK